LSIENSRRAPDRSARHLPQVGRQIVRVRDAHEIQFQHFGFAVAGDFAILSVDRHKATEARVDARNASGGLFEHRPELPFACMQCGVLRLQSRSHVIERRADLGEFVADHPG
jgi:hypothetical protein